VNVPLREALRRLKAQRDAAGARGAAEEVRLLDGLIAKLEALLS